MMSLWTPRRPPGFSSLFRMLDDFDRYAQHTVGRPMSSTGDGLSSSITIAPKFDISEHESNYSLQGELPGVPPENVNIEFTDPQTLVISGHAEREHIEGDPSLKITMGEERKETEGDKEKKDTSEKQGEKKEGEEGKEEEEQGLSKSEPKFWLSERSFGEFSRVFNFPVSVDQDKVQAKFSNGVLNIMVPKMEKKGGRKIEIK